MNFSQSIYHVDENSMNLMVTLMFTNPSSAEISVNVFSTPINVTSKASVYAIYQYIIMYCNPLLQEPLIMMLDHTILYFLMEPLVHLLTSEYLTTTLLKHQRLSI